jgi:hypothetical protein
MRLIIGEFTSEKILVDKELKHKGALNLELTRKTDKIRVYYDKKGIIVLLLK